MALLNKQKQDLFKAVSDKGFDPILFDYSEGPEIEASASLKYPRTAYFFELSYARGNENNVPGLWNISSAPGAGFVRGKFQSHSWSGVVMQVEKWLERLKSEMNTPDPWAALESQQGPDYSTKAHASNSALTFTEWEQTKNGIEEIRNLLLKEIKEGKGDVNLVNDKLDALIESGKTMGRVDWFNQTVGSIMNLIVAISLSAEAQKTIWELLKGAVSGVVHLLPAAHRLLGA